jgi:hypothetical protein
MPPDPFPAAAREALTTTLGDMRTAIEGAPSDALNWRPAGQDSNSIAVLTVHACGSTRAWLTIAVAQPWPERDRAAEFRATADDARALLAVIADTERDCLTLLGAAHGVDWPALRQTAAAPARRRE